MTRSKIGPLVLETPLGEKSSSVFRAFHLKQKTQLAVRIFSTPLGMTPETKSDFGEQIDRLKRLRHDSIVRCYGGGFDQRDAYLVYELVNGESLDVLLNRRERLAWEDVLEYGLQLCDAFSYAHRHGWVHARLRPEKILVVDGTSQIKIHDFRLIHNGNSLLANPATVQQLAYCAPESLDGQMEPATDLYSIGAVLYQMLTGTPPFIADSPPEMKEMIRKQSPDPVSVLAFDCPVWLTMIVEQCMHKEILRRPFSADALKLALLEAQKRTEQGVSVSEHVTSGFSPIQMTTQTKDEAEKVLGIKKAKKIAERRQRQQTTNFWESPLFLIAGLICIATLIFWTLLPPSEFTLRKKAEALLETGESVDWNRARDIYLTDLVTRYPDGQHAEWAKTQLDEIAMKNAERAIQRALRIGKPLSSEVEIRYSEALQLENFGDRYTALERYRAIENLFEGNEEDQPVVNLARRQIQLLESSPPSAVELRSFLETKISDADRLYLDGDRLGAIAIWESVVELYSGNQEFKDIVDQATANLKQYQAPK